MEVNNIHRCNYSWHLSLHFNACILISGAIRTRSIEFCPPLIKGSDISDTHCVNVWEWHCPNYFYGSPCKVFYVTKTHIDIDSCRFSAVVLDVIVTANFRFPVIINFFQLINKSCVEKRVNFYWYSIVICRKLKYIYSASPFYPPSRCFCSWNHWSKVKVLLFLMKRLFPTFPAEWSISVSRLSLLAIEWKLLL